LVSCKYHLLLVPWLVQGEREALAVHPAAVAAVGRPEVDSWSASEVEHGIRALPFGGCLLDAIDANPDGFAQVEVANELLGVGRTRVEAVERRAAATVRKCRRVRSDLGDD
jgi:hypothetical protein